MKPYMFLSTLSLMVSASALAINDPICDYKSETIEKTTGVIDYIKDISRKTQVYTQDKRSCMVEFQAKIGENWIQTHGVYVFGPEISENSACAQAVEKGKTRAISHLSPTQITHIAEQKCKESVPEKEPEIQVVENIVYVDSETGRRVKRNSVSRTIPCMLLAAFAPGPYNNRRCHAFD
jgi:hypothetical protein